MSRYGPSRSGDRCARFVIAASRLMAVPLIAGACLGVFLATLGFVEVC